MESKLLDISEEVYQNMCELRTANEVLLDLGYASIGQTCLECLKDIDARATKFTCISCHRACHEECLEVLANLHYEIGRRLSLNQNFECLSCIDFNRCLECRNFLDLADKKVVTCSICLRKTHQRCHPVPAKVMESGGQRKHGSLNQNHSVCQTCLASFGIKEHADSVEFNGKEFLLVLVNHLSPIHYAWIQDRQQDANIKSSEDILVDSEPEIQAIFSMHVPGTYADFTIDRIWEVLNQQILENSSLCMKNSFKFLTKWRHTQNMLIWEDASIFQQRSHQISKFLHQLKMNDISTHSELPSPILKKYYAFCIKHYAEYHNMNAEKKAIDLGESGTDRTKQGDDIDVKFIHKICCKKVKQYINIKNANSKAQAMCELVRMIYFNDKNPLPVVIVTDQSKVSWWTANLIRKASLLTVLALQGSQAYIEQMTESCFVHKNQRSSLFKFNILVVSYQNLRVISNLFDFKQALSGFSLMVMDEKMPPLGRYYYTNVKIARIKFQKEIAQQKRSNANDKTDLTQSNSEQKRSSLTLSSSRNLKLFLEKCNQQGQKLQPKSFINMLYDQFNEGYYLNDVQANGRLLNEVQRLIFLRYVLMFGLNASNKEEIYDKMMKIETTCFSEAKDASMAKLQVYINYFLVHLAKGKASIPAQIKNIFFFSVDPTLIFKTITDLQRIEIYCQHQEADPNFTLSIQTPVINLEEIVILSAWSRKYDYYICKGILHFGIGNWKELSESGGTWSENGQDQGFRYFLCRMLGLRRIKTEYFCEFLRIRAREIASAIQRRFN